MAGGDAGPPSRNLIDPVGAGTGRLFHSPAFVIGFADGRSGRPFVYPAARGPNAHLRSGQIAYERGRQFAALWQGRPVADLSEMQRALVRFHAVGAIL
jgi:hypothetical protein